MEPKGWIWDRCLETLFGIQARVRRLWLVDESSHEEGVESGTPRRESAAVWVVDEQEEAPEQYA